MDALIVATVVLAIGVMLYGSWRRAWLTEESGPHGSASSDLAEAPGTPAMETLRQALERLEASGYSDSFRAEARGLRALAADRLYVPEELEVDAIVRFEGQSDPEDQAAVFALRARDDSLRGSLVTSFGPGADPLVAEMVRRVADARA